MNMREKIAERLMQHYAEGGPWDGFIEADIVLDALMEPTAGMRIDGAVEFTKHSDASRAFTSMIRAAKEGK